jgi:putative endonuclease
MGVFHLNLVLAMNQFFVYIISNPEEIYYKGFTTDMKQRLALHNEAEGKYTSEKGPWRVLFFKSFETKSEALKYEKMLKRQNHKYLDWLISSDKNEINLSK